MPTDDALRDRLVRVGAELLRTESPGALSLREIARRAGVSHGAPRRYFPTHLSLLSAIARSGFADLSSQVTTALAATPADPRARITTLAHLYVRFAAANRGMFELMFRHDLLASGYLGLRDEALPLFRLLVDLVSANRPAGAGPPARVTAAAIWAALHGTAELWNWGSLTLATDATDPAPFIDATLTAHLGPAPSHPAAPGAAPPGPAAPGVVPPGPALLSSAPPGPAPPGLASPGPASPGPASPGSATPAPSTAPEGFR